MNNKPLLTTSNREETKNHRFKRNETFKRELPTHAKGDGMGFMGQSSF